MKSNRRIRLTDNFINEHKLSTLPPPANALFWKLWNSCLDISDKTLETDFIKGIREGTLDPAVYGGFNVSDAYYSFHGAEDYLKAAGRTTDAVLKAFLLKKHESYDKYNTTFPKIWHVKDANGIVPTQVCKEYSDFERQVAASEESIYCLIVMLPCEYLWAWLGEQLNPPAKGNLYAPWITGNNDPTGSYAIGNFIDRYQKSNEIDLERATKIYTTAMNYELLNFISATS